MSGTPSAPATATPRIIDVSVTDDTLTVDLEDGRTIAVPLGFYPRLVHGSAGERANFRISGGGFGIHWPDLDEDVGVEGLLGGKKSNESPASLHRWLARRSDNTAD
ncbi:MAG: DUF2442 domain-containing protein [Planctomycetes bacterium]|nr:DUF2442 domain-containing protein [Planctomycetota bacterium]